MLLLALLATPACSSGSHGPSGSAVAPWVNRPLPLYRIPDAKPIRYPTTAPPCRAAQLRVGQGRDGVGLGHELEELIFTNVGATTCLLRGYPTITAETPSGRRVALHPQRGGTYFGRLLPSDVPAGRHVFLDFDTTHACEGGAKPAVRYSDLVFGVPHGGTVHAGRVSITEACGLSMSELGLPERLAQPRDGPGTTGTLHAQVGRFADFRAGSVAHFVVTLTNPTATAVSFNPCPGYTEGVYASRVVVRRSFVLNCDAVHAVPAHGHVRYEMRLALPRGTAPGAAKLSWSLNSPLGPFAGTIVQIT